MAHTPDPRSAMRGQEPRRRVAVGLLLGLALSAASPEASANLFHDWSPPASPPATASELEAYRSTYYGGFYPGDAWFESDGHRLGWRPPAARSHSTWLGAYWLSALFEPGVDLSSIPDRAPTSLLGYHPLYYLDADIDPIDLVEWVPEATRIWGRQPQGSSVVHPDTGEALCWRPDRPDSVFVLGGATHCSQAEPDPGDPSSLDARATFVPADHFDIPGYRRCESVPTLEDDYAYYQGHWAKDAAGDWSPTLPAPHCNASNADVNRLYYAKGQYMTALRVASLAEAARNLALAQQRAPLGSSERVDLGQRAAAILYGFADAYPQWQRVRRYNQRVPAGVLADDWQASRFIDAGDPALADDYAGVWGDRIHKGLTEEPTQLAIAYDLLADEGAEIWGFLDAYSPLGDARLEIEERLFWGSIEEALSYDLQPAYSEPRYALFNQAAYQARGLMMLGAAIDAPEVVRYGLWKARQLLDKGVMHDNSWPESPAYFKQTLVNLENGLRAMEHWDEEPSFTSEIAGRGVGAADVVVEIQSLRVRSESSHSVLDTLCLPSDQLVPRQDTGNAVTCLTQPPNPGRPYTPIGVVHDLATGTPHPAPLRPALLPSLTHGVLARGLAEDTPAGASRYPGDDLRLDVGASANWNHAHADRLATLLWAHGTPLSYEFGGKAPGAADTLHHNTVRLGGQNQDLKLPHPSERSKNNHWEGQVLAWHPVPDEMQVIELQDRFAYRGYEDPDVSTDAAIVADEYRRTLFLIPLRDPSAPRADAQRNLILDIFEVATASPLHQEFLVHGRPQRSQRVRVVGDDTPATDDETRFGAGTHSGAVLQNAAGEHFGPPVQLHFQESEIEADGSETLQPTELALWVLGPESGFGLARAVSDLNKGASLLAVERDATHSRFVVLWEAVPPGGTPLVTHAKLLESPQPEATGVYLETADGQQVEVYDVPSRDALHWPNGIETRGRFVGLRRGPVDRLERVWLYEASAYVDPNHVGVHAEARIPRPITEVGGTNHPYWTPAPPGLPYEPLALTGVDPQWMLQLRSRAALPDPDGPDCAHSYPHSRWIPVSELPATMPDILQLAPVGGRGSGFVHDPSAPSLRDTHNPFHTRHLCDSEALDWPKVPVLQWPERAVLEQADDGTWRLLEAKSNVPAHVDPDGDPLPDAIPMPEPGGPLALAAGMLCLYALSEGRRRRHRGATAPAADSATPARTPGISRVSAAVGQPRPGGDVPTSATATPACSARAA